MNNRFKFFRYDRKSKEKKKGGGVILAVPKSLNPKKRPDLNHVSKNIFESFWIECKLTNSLSEKSRQLINISYNQQKKHYNSFLEELSTSIDNTITEKKPLVLMGDYNINYFDKKERECLETILTPYGLNVMNKDHATRVQNQSRTLIDFIITDHLKSEIFETFVSDSVFRTSKNKSIDHRATSVLGSLKIEKRCNVTIKEVFDKSNYKRDDFCQKIQRSDWCRFYRQKSAEEMFYVFNDILKNAMRKCVFRKKIFIRNDKNLLTIQKSWVEKESIEIYNKMKQFMNPNDTSYNKIQQKVMKIVPPITSTRSRI